MTRNFLRIIDDPNPLRNAHHAAEAALVDLEGLFKPGSRLTLIMRTPGNPEAEIVWTKDNLVEVIKVLERTRLRQAVVDSGEPCPGGDGCGCCCARCDCGCRDACPKFLRMIQDRLKGGVA